MYENTLYTADRDHNALPCVEVPEEGVTFEAKWTKAGVEHVESITLKELLAGLRTIPARTDGVSQAQTFASYALQNGFSSEEEILKAYPNMAPKVMNLYNLATKVQILGDHGRPAQFMGSRSFNLIDKWRSAVEADQSTRAAQTMKENGTRISESQIDFALDLMDRLKAKDAEAFKDLVNQLGKLSVIDDEDEPMGYKMKLAITKACKILGIRNNRSNSGSGVITSSDSNEDPF